MRALILGGTGFVGRALVGELRSSGHRVLVVHRGRTEPDGLGTAEHLHSSREHLERVLEDIRRFAPEVFVDVTAGTKPEAAQALRIVDELELRPIALSSGDVYRAYDSLRADAITDPMPLAESAPVRVVRYPDRDEGDTADYEKLDVEDAYLARSGTVLRLPMVYGAHDDQRREDFVLRRIRAGRNVVPTGDGSLLWTRGSVDQIASAIRRSIEVDARGEVINVGEATTAPIALWVRWIAEAAGSRIDLVRVPDDVLPADLTITRGRAQHLQFDVTKAATVLGWQHADPKACVAASVRWHMEHPPPGTPADLSGDDAALSRA